jgi:hypothetical protein
MFRAPRSSEQPSKSPLKRLKLSARNCAAVSFVFKKSGFTGGSAVTTISLGAHELAGLAKAVCRNAVMLV